jgi:hypothetical protein
MCSEKEIPLEQITPLLFIKCLSSNVPCGKINHRQIQMQSSRAFPKKLLYFVMRTKISSGYITLSSSSNVPFLRGKRDCIN